MIDPLADILRVLKPRAVFSKGISAAGSWAVRYAAFGHPSFCTMLQGSCRLAVDGYDAVMLEAGDFLLLPATPGLTMSGFEAVTPTFIDPRATAAPTEEIRHGRQDGPPEMRQLGGYFVFDSPDAALIVALLPGMVHVRSAARLGALVRLVGEETADKRFGRDLILTRLVEILIIEALRANQGEAAPQGLLRGLADTRLAEAMRQIHADPARHWTVDELAKTSALSRSSFFERFTRAIGMPPMEYLLAWRMALAKDMLQRQDLALAKIAEKVGYGSASAFSTAFSRHVGLPPGQYGRQPAS